MAAADLLQQLEPHTHGERVKAMIALGHQADAESRDIIGQLERGNMYKRMLALYSCIGSRDSAHVLRPLHPHGYALPAVADRLATTRNFTTRGGLPVLRVVLAVLAVLAEEPLECHERVAS